MRLSCHLSVKLARGTVDASRAKTREVSDEQSHHPIAGAQPRLRRDRHPHAHAAAAVPAPPGALHHHLHRPANRPRTFLGLRFAEAIVARTVGGRVTPAVIQDLSYIGYLVESKAPEGPYFEAAIIHHTDCGSGLLADEPLRHGFAQRTGYDEGALADLPVLDPRRSPDLSRARHSRTRSGERGRRPGRGRDGLDRWRRLGSSAQNNPRARASTRPEQSSCSRAARLIWVPS
jgi:hypothetical protein